MVYLATDSPFSAPCPLMYVLMRIHSSEAEVVEEVLDGTASYMAWKSDIIFPL